MDNQRDYDAVIVGGGHNGLVCAAYLVRAGQRVCVVEARSAVGGCAGSEVAVGATVNICNCDHSLVRTLPLIDDLDLEHHGLRYLDLDPGQIGLGWDAPGPVPLFRSVDRTVEAIGVHFPEEADNYRRYATDALPVAKLVLDLAAEIPGSRAALALAMRSGRAGARALSWSRRSVGDVLGSYFSADGLLGPAMAGGPAVWGLASATPGTGLGALAYAFKHVAPVGRPVGGSGSLTDALASRIVAGGGAIITEAVVDQILCDGDEVRAVSYVVGGGDGAEHRTVTAASVVVACDPNRAFASFLSNPPPGAERFVSRWRQTAGAAGYESKIDARLSELPTWRHSADDRLNRAVGFDDHHSASTLVAPGLDGIDAAHGLMADGRVTRRPMLFVNVPSKCDPTVAPPGEHVFSLEVLFTPYGLRGGWVDSPEPERWLSVVAELFEPGFESTVREWRAVTPAEYERRFYLPRGHAASYSAGPVSALLGRGDELTRYETPIAGLFVTGAATFPGAGVWGAAGRNTARVMLRVGS